MELGPAGFTPAGQRSVAAPACFPLAEIERALGGEYGERRRFAGREEGGIEYRLYVNAATGTWSWVGIPADAAAGCLLFAGRTNSASPPERPAPPQARF